MFKIKDRSFLVCTVLMFISSIQGHESPWIAVSRGGSMLWDHASMEQHYAEIKEAVCLKMGSTFTAAFNQKYPQSSKDAVRELAPYIDSLTEWQESFPPQATATIGSKKIALKGDIARIIYDMCDGKGGPYKVILPDSSCCASSCQGKKLTRGEKIKNAMISGFTNSLVFVFGPCI